MRGSLLERVAAGDNVAVQECIDEFGGLVHSLARRLCANDSDAEDAVQEIFIDLWTYAHRYDRERGSQTTFVAMIARRRLIDRWRKTQRRPAPEALTVDVATSARLAASSAPSGDPLETADDAAIAKRALATLDEKHQRIIQLAIYHGLTHDAIAKTLGMPLGTVKTIIRRSLKKVRDTLNRAPAQERRGSRS